MAEVPVNYKFMKMAASMLNEAARMRLCESSGSEHYSPDDLSDLVNSFIESDDEPHNQNDDKDNDDGELIAAGFNNICSSDFENKKNKLENLLNRRDDDAIKRIQAETGIIIAPSTTSERSSHGFKRRLMSHLQHLGFDAGICKTRWEKCGRYPAGEYEFVDVNVGGNRLIVEVCVAAEFEIARPSSNYTALLDVLPPVFIGKPEELKQLVKLMCGAIKNSMKQMNLHVPPWRTNGYMQAKWSGVYKRTTNQIPTKLHSSPVKAYHCRAGGKNIGYLTAAFNANIQL